MLIVFHKPYGVLSQFTPDVDGQRTLAEFGFPKGVYSLGRLDLDSEGMMLLSDEKGLNSRLLDPKSRHWRRYIVQVEGEISPAALSNLSAGVVIQGKKTLPARARLCQPEFPPREPPIRFRQNIPTTWLALELHEGRNRQVRRMTAAVGFPTLRLIRVRIGDFDLPINLKPGKWREVSPAERRLIFDKNS